MALALPMADAVEFTADDVRAVLAAGEVTASTLMDAYGAVYAKFATVHARPSRAVLRLCKARRGKEAA